MSSIRSRSRSRTTAWPRSPRRWASCSAARRSRPTSRSGATTPAPCSTPAAALVAQAAHIPVHLGSTPLSVRAAIARVPMEPGDVVVLNDPFAGGTHLPDVTVVAPVFARGARRPVRATSRTARTTPTSAACRRARCRSPARSPGGPAPAAGELVARGRLADDVLALFLANTRVPAEREGDLAGAVGGAAGRRRAPARPGGAPRRGRACWRARWRRCRTTRRRSCARRCAPCRAAPTARTTCSTTTASAPSGLAARGGGDARAAAARASTSPAPRRRRAGR